MDHHQELTVRIAGHFRKNCGILFCSGSAAIEASMDYVGVPKNGNVLIPSICCHQIPRSIIRAGRIPIISDVGDSLLIGPAHVAKAVETVQVDAVFVVHQFGLPADVGGIRALVGSRVPIIEDVAQAWGLVSRGTAAGQHSDAVVTSFGPGKPLTVGEGGGLFGGDEFNILERFDWRSLQARTGNFETFPYPFSKFAYAALEDALACIDELMVERKTKVEALIRCGTAAGLRVWQKSEGDEPSWGRIPFFTRNESVAKLIEELAAECGPKLVQRWHTTPLHNLAYLVPRVKLLPTRFNRTSLASLVLVNPDLLSVDVWNELLSTLK